MVRIQSSLSFIRVPSRALGTKSASRQHTALCLGQKRQGTPTYADDQHKKEKQRASKGSRGLAVGRGRSAYPPPFLDHSTTCMPISSTDSQRRMRMQEAGSRSGTWLLCYWPHIVLQGPGGRGRTPPGSQMFIYLSYTDAASVQAMNRQTAVLKRCVTNMKDTKRQNQRPHFTAEKAKAQEPGSKGHSGR